MHDPDSKPQLRFVEAHPVQVDDHIGFLLSDPRRLARGTLTVNEPTLFVMSKLDGRHTLVEVSDAFLEHYGRSISMEELRQVVDALQQTRYLAGEDFDRYYQSLVTDYRAAPARVMESAADLGLATNTNETLQRIIDSALASPQVRGRIVGLVAPHLDYTRGAPCYAAAYAALAERPAPRRIVILGTNHFGSSAGVVTTGKPFATPLGLTGSDLAFIEMLEARLGDLRAGEFDHLREHSIELELLFCQHIWGAEAFGLVAVLCPDPCGPTGTAPLDGQGPDLRVFAEALGKAVRESGDDTLIIAGADLSHVGPQFGEQSLLDAEFLDQVRRRDQSAVDSLSTNKAERFIAQVASDENPTRICSAGCIAATLFALPDASVNVLRYHQAVDDARTAGVTCIAAVLTE